jgi:ATP-dependent RNA helicase RhlE
MDFILFDQLKENLTLNKFNLDKQYQLESFKKIKSGGDFVVLDSNLEETLIAIFSGILEKTKSPADDDAPRILVILPSESEVLIAEQIWVKLSKRTEIIHTLTTEKGNKIKQRLALFNGADIVLGTPKRSNELYFQNGINVNHLKYFLLINANKCVKNSSIGQISRMCDSFPKCQKIIVDTEIFPNTEKIIDKILTHPIFIESSQS